MKILFYLLIVFSLFSCSQFPIGKGLGPHLPPPPTEIPIKGLSDGIEYRENYSKKDRVLEFSEDNQTYDIKPDEKVVISLDYNLADGDLIIMSRFNRDSNKITIGLYDNFRKKPITLKRKCEVVEIRGLTEIPEIILDEELIENPQQVIITPLFDEACNPYGYQIRYGSTGNGCNLVAKKVLDRFNKCTETGDTSQPPNSHCNKKCWEYKWFHICCP